ncbi:putative pre-60S factor [Rosellinia necatrix]|uniref:Putative pre-60S factor n=1 Tax=Rosellinia necatrix TaxID=77044 RepID=A0A1W2TXF1_ROSNE|nr:putative pre-60S factor [Rosellinia necatrix]
MPFEASVDSPDAAMQPFTPGQCLFCPSPASSFADSVAHMQKSHGLFIPHQESLAVDLETLFKYLHLVIFGYRECIHCGTERATVQGVQQHMTGKGHCRFDVSEPDSEFAEFYDFSELRYDDDDDDDGEEDDGEEEDDDNRENEGRTRNLEETATGPSRKPVLADEDSIRLPSGRIISRQAAAPGAGPSSAHPRRRPRPRPSASKLDYTPTEPTDVGGEEEEEPAPGNERREGDDTPRPPRPLLLQLSRRERRERAAATYELVSMSAGDRHGLAHLTAAERRAALAAQHRQAEKVQKEQGRRRGKIDRKGNKNLYAYWHTETPVYQCG